MAVVRDVAHGQAAVIEDRDRQGLAEQRCGIEISCLHDGLPLLWWRTLPTKSNPLDLRIS